MSLKRFLYGVFAALLLAGSAAAQSAPGFYNGWVPTAQQWNSFFAAKQDYYPGAVIIQGPGASTPGDLVCWNGTYPQVYDCGPVHVPRGYIDGLNMQAAGGTASLSVGAGEATDTTGTALETLGSSLNKTTGAWAQGSNNGCLDAGSIANSSWYHVFLIEKTDRSASDILCSTSALTPTLPSGWTYYRRIGSVLTDGSAHWVGFTQHGDEFRWGTPINDVNVSALGTTATNYTVSAPPSVPVIVRQRGIASNASANVGVVLSSPWIGTPIAGSPAGEYAALTQVSGQAVAIPDLATMTQSQQVTAVASASGTTLKLDTYGWLDFRGRNK